MVMSSGRRSFVRWAVGAVAAVALVAAGQPGAVAAPKNATPTPQITSGPAAYTSSRSATLAFTDARTDATFTCSLDGATFKSCKSPVTYTNLAEAAHTFRVRAKSPSLRPSSVVSLSWTVDVTPPAQPTVNGPSSPTTSATVTVRFSSTSSDVDHYLCSLDGGPQTTCTSPASVNAPDQGLHVYSVVAVDRAGNTSTAGTAYWYRDSVTPVPVINLGPADPTTATDATFTFSSSEGGVTFGCRLDGGSFTACTSGTSYTGLGLGTHTFVVRATDSNGNTADSATYTWHRVSSLSVTLGWSDPAGLPSANSRSRTATFAYAAGGATTVTCVLDATPVGGCGASGGSPVVSGLPDGPHTFTITADAGLPTQVVMRYGWTVDTVAPEAPVVLGPSGVVASTSASLTVLASAVGDTLACTLDGNAVACSSPVSLTNLGQGAHTFRVTEADLAGNTAATALTWTVDTVAPVITVTQPTTVSGPVRLTANEVVTGLTTSSVILRPAGGAALATTLACATAGGAATPCDTATVRSARLTPSSPLVPGEHYEVLVNPAGAATVTDAAGNKAAASTTPFRGALLNQENSAAASYRWRRVATTKALGGSYLVEHRAGASASYAFAGTAVTWVTATGPAGGRAKVYVDGVRKLTVDTYASSAHWRVGRTVSGLAAGSHTLKVVVLGTKRAAARDSQVVVDGFRVGTSTVASPALRMTWPTARTSKAMGGGFAQSDSRGATTTFRFRGTGITWIRSTGPGFGKAAVFIDGTKVATVDSWSRTSRFRVARSFGKLADKVHTVRLAVLGRHRAAATGSLVAVEAWRVS